MKNRFITLMLAFMLVVTITGYGRAADLSEDGVNKEPQLLIAHDRWMQEFEAGSQAELKIPIKNVGGRAKNNQITLVVDDPKTFPFEIDKMTFMRYIPSISGDSAFSLPVTIPASVEPGIYPLTINIAYESESGSSGSVSGTVYVRITNSMRQPRLRLMGVQLEGDALASGQSQAAKISVKNDGELPLKSVTMKLTGFSSDGINLDNWPDTQYIESIQPLENHMVEFRFKAAGKMASGTYAVDAALQYQDDYGHKYTQEEKLYLTVEGTGDSDDLTPRILLDNYYIGSDYVMAGQNFPLTLIFVNTSTTKTVRNIKVSLSAEDDIFAPVGSSNSFYFPVIEPNASVEHTITLNPRPTAEHKVYTLTAKLDYQDEEGNKLEEQEIISLPVVKEMKLHTSDVEVAAEAYAGSPASISLELYNTGRSNIRNLMIHTEGDFEVQNGTLFIGLLEAGKDDYYDATLIPAQPGQLKGKVILTFENELGDPYQLEKTFALNVMEAAPAGPMGPDMPVPEPGPSSPVKKWMIAAGAVLLAAAVGVVVLIRRRRRKHLEEVDIDE